MIGFIFRLTLIAELFYNRILDNHSQIEILIIILNYIRQTLSLDVVKIYLELYLLGDGH